MYQPDYKLVIIIMYSKMGDAKKLQTVTFLFFLFFLVLFHDKKYPKILTKQSFHPLCLNANNTSKVVDKNGHTLKP